MAVIMKIRERFGIIVSVLIAFALLVFVLTSALNSSGGLFNGHSDVVGKVNGETIHAKAFDQEVRHEEETYKLYQPDGKIDDETSNSFRDQAWNKLVSQYISNDQFVRLGLVTGDDAMLSKEERLDLFYGANPSPEIKRNFADPKTGLFDPNNVKNFVEGLKSEKDPKRIAAWANITETVLNSAPQMKYNTLIAKSFYIPKWMAEADYHDKNDKASIHFVSVPYGIIPDKDAPVTEDDMKKYLQEHKERFKQEETERAVDFVVFTVNPSHDDTEAAVTYINKAREIFLERDTNAIKKIAEKPDDNYYYNKEELKSYKSDSVFKQKAGSVYGPYYEDGLYKLFKILDKRDVPDSAKVAQIFIHPAKPEDSTKAKKKADSLFALLTKGKANFDTLAMKFSDDAQTKTKGGDIGWVKQGMLPPNIKPISDFIFKEAKKKDDIKVVKTEYGYHILKITEIGLFNPRIKIAFVTRKLEPSQATDKSVYNQANAFASKCRTDSAFLKTAKAQKLNMQDVENVKPNDQKLTNIPARELVRWVYNAKKGDVSDVITCGDKYVVALLTRIANEGTKTLEDPVVRRNVEALIRKDKKSAAIMAKYFAGPASSNIESYATALNTNVQEAKDIIAANPYIPNLGFEPKVIGAVFSGKPGETLKPIQGESGVYVIHIDEINAAPGIADYSQNRAQLLNMYGQHIARQEQDVLRKLLHVEDLRYKVYNQN